MDTFFAFLSDNAPAILGLLSAVLAAGGAGTLLLKRLLGERESAAPPPKQPVHGEASGDGVVIVHTGKGNAEIHKNTAATVTPALARDLGLKHETVIDAVCRLADPTGDPAVLEARMAAFASDWHAARKRVDALYEAHGVGAGRRDELEGALRSADLAHVDRLCRALEGESEHRAPADRVAG
jgi:hypothetical protein